MSVVVIAGGFDEMRRASLDELAARYELDPEEAQMIADFKRCRAEGHQWHTCPACGDRACLRCGTASNA